MKREEEKKASASLAPFKGFRKFRTVFLSLTTRRLVTWRQTIDALSFTPREGFERTTSSLRSMLFLRILFFNGKDDVRKTVKEKSQSKKRKRSRREKGKVGEGTVKSVYGE